MYIVFTMWFHNGDAKHIDITTGTLASPHRAKFARGFSPEISVRVIALAARTLLESVF